MKWNGTWDASVWHALEKNVICYPIGFSWFFTRCLTFFPFTRASHDVWQFVTNVHARSTSVITPAMDRWQKSVKIADFQFEIQIVIIHCAVGTKQHEFQARVPAVRRVDLTIATVKPAVVRGSTRVNVGFSFMPWKPWVQGLNYLCVKFQPN